MSCVAIGLFNYRGMNSTFAGDVSEKNSSKEFWRVNMQSRPITLCADMAYLLFYMQTKFTCYFMCRHSLFVSLHGC